MLTNKIKMVSFYIMAYSSGKKKMANSSSGKKKILLVDDNEIQLTVYEVQLKTNYEVTTAMSGNEALDYLFRGFMPDLIILDILMPEMDGWETFGRLRAVGRLQKIPIIFLSSLSDKKVIDRAFGIGAVDFIVKPCDFVEFLDRVEKAVGK
jgi:PleD family two-component response regulator